MPRGGDAGGGKKGSSVQFSRPQEPSFLRDLKKQVGYKDPVEDMNAKVDNIDLLGQAPLTFVVIMIPTHVKTVIDSSMHLYLENNGRRSRQQSRRTRR